MQGSDLLGVLTTPGYVSMIMGEPGVGKTSLALMACARHGRCTYISYADPPGVIEEKMKVISPGFSGSLKVINTLVGPPEETLESMTEAVGRGELAVIDTVDAMVSGFTGSIRPLFQIVYGSVKAKPGSLIIISEGGAQALQLRFLADALVSIEFEDVLGQKVRAVRLLKDRDRPIPHPLHFATFSNMSMLEPYSMHKLSKLAELREARLPPLLQLQSQREFGPSILMELDESVTSMTARLYIEFIIAKLLKDGLSVNWMTGPNEPEMAVLEEVRALAGPDFKRLRIVKADPAKAEYKAEKFMDMMVREQGPQVVDVVNLMAQEDFAVIAPLEYERFVNAIIKDAGEKGRLELIYGYSGLRSVKIERKYVHAIRRMTVVEGFLFWRSIRPLSPVYFVRMEPSQGRIEFVEMM